MFPLRITAASLALTVVLACAAGAAQGRAQPTVQAAGFSTGGGPSGVAWVALSVFGSVVAALGRRARHDE